jgi:hypothetical protein
VQRISRLCDFARSIESGTFHCIRTPFPLTPTREPRHTRLSLSSTLQGTPPPPEVAPARAETPTVAVSPPARVSHHPIRRILRALAILIPIYVLAVWLDAWFTHLPPLAGTPGPGERVGILHVHTNASCGSGSLSEVIASAKKAALSFLAVTDHNVAMSRAAVEAADPPEFAVIDGEEVSTSAGHYLALGLTNAWPRGTSYDAHALMASTRAAGAVNFIAHPYGLREKWRDWSVTDYEGMEIFNDDAIWRKNTIFDLFNAFILYPVDSRLALLRLARTPHENLAKWDELQRSRPVAGICGSDAHAAISMSGHIIARFPGYLAVFSLIREHALLPPTPATDAGQTSASAILTALKNGNSFCSVDALYPADGFTQTVTAPATDGATRGARLHEAEIAEANTNEGKLTERKTDEAITNDTKTNDVNANEAKPSSARTNAATTPHATTITAGPGNSIAFVPGAVFHVHVPAGAPNPQIRVLRDGKEIAREQSSSLDLALPGPGLYRAEAYLRQPGLTGWRRWTLWVVPNPVRVTAP